MSHRKEGVSHRKKRRRLLFSKEREGYLGLDLGHFLLCKRDQPQEQPAAAPGQQRPAPGQRRPREQRDSPRKQPAAVRKSQLGAAGRGETE